MAARLSIIEYDGKILCANANHWGLRPVKELGKTLRDSDYGGTSMPVNLKLRYTWPLDRIWLIWTGQLMREALFQ